MGCCGSKLPSDGKGAVGRDQLVHDPALDLIPPPGQKVYSNKGAYASTSPTYIPPMNHPAVQIPPSPYLSIQQAPLGRPSSPSQVYISGVQTAQPNASPFLSNPAKQSPSQMYLQSQRPPSPYHLSVGSSQHFASGNSPPGSPQFPAVVLSDTPPASGYASSPSGYPAHPSTPPSSGRLSPTLPSGYPAVPPSGYPEGHPSTPPTSGRHSPTPSPNIGAPPKGYPVTPPLSSGGPPKGYPGAL
mmetsp:Transcript_6087/g.10519  ORF Transcript_6087/g.10519 Transcript_6087/m.10519 type:complete len:243 (-) Transcript_6087:743-1471(-)|eukprot:CAMPEP_0196664830 /NCGR_PEP_ID=MMETSP1086-20130531/58588_1 /TAXON_ID=77921 /ORGANISM="Cyanoptyche  gloeocystis , Strain SAG4.97" /LENGTH=242 /DNA_ID=CAMNT_0042001307 /DNA_START=108 /DNA_END=836 /DNA_ORIENTATION=+